MCRVTPSARDSFGTLKAPSSSMRSARLVREPTLMLRVGVPLEEGTVPSGRPARAQQFAISVNSNSLGLANKFCVFCVVCVKLESHPGGRTSLQVLYSRQFVAHLWSFVLKKKTSRSTIASETSDFVYKFESKFALINISVDG